MNSPGRIKSEIRNASRPVTRVVNRSTRYLNLAAAIRQEILSGLPANAQLPSEPELAARFGAARATIRRALAELQQEGLITSRQGAGTFVAEPRVEQDLEQLFSFTEFMLQRGLHPGSRLLLAEARVLRNDASDVLRHLRLHTGSRVIHIRRLRLGGGDPLVIANTWLPAARFPGLLRRNLQKILQHHSIYELMEQMDQKPTYAAQSIEVKPLGPEDASLLATQPGLPALIIQRVGYAHDIPVEYAMDYYRADRTRFHVRLGTAAIGR